MYYINTVNLVDCRKIILYARVVTRLTVVGSDMCDARGITDINGNICYAS